MKKITVVISLALAISTVACDYSSPATKASNLATMNTLATSASQPIFTPHAASLAEQKMCDEQAQKRFRKDNDELSSRDDHHNPFTAAYYSHFDPSVNVCYVRMDRSFPYQTTSDVYDAFEGHSFASYVRVEGGGNPLCLITLPSKDPITCSSIYDFNELVGKYFGLSE